MAAGAVGIEGMDLSDSDRRGPRGAISSHVGKQKCDVRRARSGPGRSVTWHHGAAPESRLWHLVHMTWEWMASAGTVIVALAGIGATMRTAAQGRSHAEHLATENHRRAHQDMRRQERLKVYANALANVVDEERRLDAVWAPDGKTAFKLSPEPPGAPMSLASMDEITVQMQLLADGEVEHAWRAFVSAWEALRWWGELESSGDPDEEAPEHLTQPLRVAIAEMKALCRKSLE